MPKSKKLLRFTLDDGTGDRPHHPQSGIHAYYEPEELVGKTLIAITNLPPRKMMGVDSCGHAHVSDHEVHGDEEGRGAAEPPDGGRPHPRRRQAVLGACADDSRTAPFAAAAKGAVLCIQLLDGW